MAYLESKGYTIEARNWRRLSYEIDIVAKGDNSLVFVEVKSARPGPFGPPELLVTKTKQKRIATAALEYLSHLESTPDEVRFDVIAITWRDAREPEICHLEAAFTAELDW